MNTLDKIALDPRFHDLFSILKGCRNGIVYGTKVRFPHALVMTVLFKTDSLENKVKGILMATKQHAQNLGLFATIYKTLMIVQKKLNGDKEASVHPFIAGVIGGYYVFGENNSINQQIILYLFSRAVLAMVKVPVQRQIMNAPEHTYPVFAAVVWGVIMWLFRHETETVQPSLRASMQYIYRDSDSWSSFKTLFWHNK
ncbi:peroxisomal membrane protein 4-like protein [Blakeslea trispora]|nr:peroxisomal membrane protein 4-like protein [Blakeslea trispora]